MSSIFSPTRTVGSPMRSMASPIKDVPKHADLTITDASVHPRDWHMTTIRDREVATASKLGSTALRSETTRRREYQDHALRATGGRVNLALQQRVDETRNAIAGLENSLQETEIEIDNLENHKQEVDGAIADNQQKAEVPRQCLIRRSMRPHPEKVLDEAEVELTAELREYEQAIKKLVEEQRRMEVDLRSLRAAKFKIERNLKDKREALAADESCLDIRSSGPL